MNILLAGGAGYIGSHTAVELLTAGHDVVIVDNYCNSCAEAVNRVEEVSGKKVVSYEADVKDKVAMAKIFAENKIDCVIHFAGLKAVGESVQKPIGRPCGHHHRRVFRQHPHVDVRHGESHCGASRSPPGDRSSGLFERSEFCNGGKVLVPFIWRQRKHGVSNVKGRDRDH